MSIIQFLRILWAHRLLTMLTIVATAIGAAIAVVVVPASYEAKTRVMLNTLKPDPITGEVIPTNASRAYITTQKELIRDVVVAGQAVEQLGWLNDPEVIRTYGAANGEDSDIRRAMAQRIIDRTQVDVIGGTNILEIVFRSPTADQARGMANALRDAYIETTLSSRRREATRNAEWYALQGQKERELLDKADEVKTAFEKSSGIVMQDATTDIETARLRALSSVANTGSTPIMAAPIVQSSASAIQLAQLDAQIAQSGRTLGPNHPQMIQMNAQRATLAKVVAQDEVAARSSASSAAQAAAASAGAMSRAVQSQTSRVLASRDKIERLTQLQGEVNLHRAQMEKALARASELRQEAAVADSGIAVLSEAVTPRKPAFPNKPLIFGGGIGLGAGIGLLLSLLLELVRRRVRGAEDLHAFDGIPLLAVISTQPLKSRPLWETVRKGGIPSRRRQAAAA